MKEYPEASGLKPVIENAPTDYDVEKVVEHVRQDCYSMGFNESQTEIVVADIRKGGVKYAKES